MKGRAAACLAIGALALLGLAVLARWTAQPVWPSYLAAWLAASLPPLGALTLVMGRDLIGLRETPLAVRLRAMLPGVPIAALGALPLLSARDLAVAPPGALTPFAATWMAPHAITGRAAAILVLWLVLSVAFRRPSAAGARAGRAGAGLALQVVAVTLLALDWVGAADRDLTSPSLGLALLLAQAVAALAVAGLATRRGADPHALSPGVVPLMVVYAAWLFVQFTQYLVVWSANLPVEADWYVRRSGVLGGLAAAAAPLALVIGIGGFLPRIGSHLERAFEVLTLAVAMVSMFWLVVPGSRGILSLTPVDAVALAGLAGLLAGVVLLAWRAAPEVVRDPV